MKSRVSTAFFLAVLICGCTTIDGVGRYRVQSVGNAQRSIEATVISARQAYIAFEPSGRGAAAGGIAGGGLAGLSSDNVGVIIAGVVGGMIVGSAIEASENVHEATEYVIKSSTQAIFTVAQINEGNPIFQPGDNVILVYGYPSRLIDNRGM